MSGIVVITTKGGAKRYFANTLQKETGAVKLAILQFPKKKSLFKRISGFYKKVGFTNIIQEVYSFLSVKFSARKKHALSLVSLRSKEVGQEGGYLMETLETCDINEDWIYERVREINPDVVVIYGGHILKTRLLELAPHAFNIHFGFAPYYRGVNGIENAILNEDLEHVGVTIHYAVSKVDAGEIIKVITADHRLPPEQFFQSLNDRAIHEYMNVIKRVLDKEQLESKPQDISLGKNYVMRDWTYKKENLVADKIIKWQNKK